VNIVLNLGASGASAGPGYPLQFLSPLRGLAGFPLLSLARNVPESFGGNHILIADNLLKTLITGAVSKLKFIRGKVSHCQQVKEFYPLIAKLRRPYQRTSGLRTGLSR
jgi:hypothetical protein